MDDFEDMSFLDEETLKKAESKALEKSAGGGEIIEDSDECEGGACKI